MTYRVIGGRELLHIGSLVTVNRAGDRICIPICRAMQGGFGGYQGEYDLATDAAERARELAGERAGYRRPCPRCLDAAPRRDQRSTR